MSAKITGPYRDILVNWIKDNMHVMRNPPTVDGVDAMDNSELERLSDCIERILQ